MKKESVHCDICGKDAPHQLQLQVIFTTEQNEGRACDPYLDKAKVDLCDNDRDRVLRGEYVFAEGAMGFNRFFFRRDIMPVGTLEIMIRSKGKLNEDKVVVECSRKTLTHEMILASSGDALHRMADTMVGEFLDESKVLKS